MAALRVFNYLRRSASADELGKKNEPTGYAKAVQLPNTQTQSLAQAGLGHSGAEKRRYSTSFEHERKTDLIYRDQDDRAAAACMERKSQISLAQINQYSRAVPPPTPVWNYSQIDILLEYKLQMRHIPVPDEAGNEEAVARAVASGVKVRDFGTMKQTKNKVEIPEIFRAHEKALIFYYMRWLFSRDVFDIPHVSLTVEDVDRLYTLGYIMYDCNFTVGRAMLAHGAYRRSMRGTGRPTYYGQLLPEKGTWTVAANSRIPTNEEIDWFINRSEQSRFREELKGEYSVYSMAPSYRPRVNYFWRQHRSAHFGLFGLKHARISDENAVAYINTPDRSFIPPQTFCPIVTTQCQCPFCEVQVVLNQLDSGTRLVDKGRETKIEAAKYCRNPENPVSEVDIHAADAILDNGNEIRQKRPREAEDQEKPIRNTPSLSTKRSKIAIIEKGGNDHRFQINDVPAT